ncbi:MAG: V-type ATPase subunit [Gammaproteobacteria bacterium]|nr:V-type ATPase subunit [Gammaproteobacteria bacterium]
MLKLSESYLQTRLSLFAGRLLTDSDINRLLDSEAETLSTRLIELLGDSYSFEKFSLMELDQVFIEDMLNDFKILIRSFNGVERDFLIYTIRWFELSNLKVLIRGKFSGVEEQIIRSQLMELGSFADLPIDKLLSTEDPPEMLRMLEYTPYASIVRQARRVFEEEGNDLFALNAAIDRSFFMGIRKRMLIVERDEQQDLRDVFSVLMDRFNLVWLLRYRFSYGFSSAKLYYLLSFSGKYLGQDRLMHLAKQDSVEAVLDGLPEPLFSLLKGSTDVVDIENKMEKFSDWVSVKTLRRSHSSLARAFAYILLRESQVKVIQAIIKGKMMGLDLSLIKTALGRS